VHYLQPAAVDQTLDFVRRNSAPGSAIIFDYVYASALTASRKRGEIDRMRRAARFTGEGLIFGIEEGTVAEFLQSRGFSQVTNVTSQDLERAYFTGPNQGRTVAPIYAIVSATVEGH
jgi:O-methyltransferase involved in polyketide biosynthesis